MEKRLIARYTFEDANNIGKDYSGNGNDAVALGVRAPKTEEICGRTAAHFYGGEYGVSYFLTKPLHMNVILDTAKDALGIS